jgi:hypothetical protein
MDEHSIATVTGMGGLSERAVVQGLVGSWTADRTLSAIQLPIGTDNSYNFFYPNAIFAINN